MNIFRVMASSKKGFQEEYASAVLAWLLNPTMDHGLGWLFLKAFVEKIGDSTSRGQDLKGMLDKMCHEWRNRPLAGESGSDQGDGRLKFYEDIEVPVIGLGARAFIDVVLYLDDLIIAIENKVRAASASDPDQLVKQYKGLNDAYKGKRIVMVFLVPESEARCIDAEYENLEKEIERSRDVPIRMTWAEVRNILAAILAMERSFEIDPLSTMTRDTLASLITFIDGDFEGYPYESQTRQSSDNQVSAGRKKLSQFRSMAKASDEYYIGIGGGMATLLTLDSGEMESRSYQFTETAKGLEGNGNWIRLKDALAIADALKTGDSLPSLDWSSYARAYPMAALVRICSKSKEPVFVGILGGEEGLREALAGKTSEDAARLRWGIAAEQKTRNWIPASRFLELTKEKTR